MSFKGTSIPPYFILGLCFPQYLPNYVILCPIWYHLYNLKNVKNTHRVALLLVKLPATLLKVTLHHDYFLRFFKLYIWYQIGQSIAIL